MNVDPGATRERAVLRLRELARLAEQSAVALPDEIAKAAGLVRETLSGGGTLFFCGNGGSAADAQHIATVYVVRYMRNRRALPAIALTTDTSLLTAVANDYGFDGVFARQVEALGRAGDVLLGISTSGASANVVRAFEQARSRELRTIALTGEDGGKLGPLADVEINVPSSETSHIQEAHIAVGQLIAFLVEDELYPG